MENCGKSNPTMKKKKKNKPHVVCVPLPAQGHINPMLKLAKLLHFNGFHITFVHTDFIYHRLLQSRGLDSLNGLDDFRFEMISDGLPPTNQRGILDLPALCRTMPIAGRSSFRELLMKLENLSEVPPVSCIVSDGVMGFTSEVAEEFGILQIVFFTPSGCGMLGYLNFQELIDRGYFPLKDESYLSNGFLDSEIDWIAAMKGIKLKDLPTFLRTTDPNDTMFNYNLHSINTAMKAKALILNTFQDLEKPVLDAMKTKFQNLYNIGPISLLLQNQVKFNDYLNSIESNLWKEENDKCFEWLDKRETESVIYVNFGSLITVTRQQLSEFAWGLADSNYSFLWVIRADLVDGGEEIIKSKEFVKEIEGRGLIVGWCWQEKVLRHDSVGGFLSHCGWNSVLESVCEGVPLICWPFFAEQQTNCFFACEKWGIGMEIDGDVKRKKVEGLVRELMEGGEGRKMREKCREWKRKAEQATAPGGSSYSDFHDLVKIIKECTNSFEWKGCD